MKRISFLIVCIFSNLNLFAQSLQSPDQFLGYDLGTKLTPQYKIVEYFKLTASSMPQMMKLEQYGETNEGRSLELAFITSPENFKNLEEIRKNNLRLTGLLNDKPGDINAPAIVWLSYNIHGDEPSSAEVSMKVLYELLNPSNASTKEWLKNTVVIIDPCVNPDGHDRYVNWFIQMQGKNPNVNPEAREHVEQWPGGRTNHYNFDLNRDWAWQTQIETQQRIKMYNQWMPQIHCDFHEQEVNDPYYFAPAAEPLHEVITPWQREFQKIVGKNHAKYFDANGWLYFTKEEFDLFYPAYGDTYPMFNGAIGMTYEEAGNASAGTAVLKTDGDTLTLKDRIAHHFTTSMSTIETASMHATELITQFKKYFDDAKTNGTGIYKSYIIKTKDESKNKIDMLKALMDRNEIQYSIASKTKAIGYNYITEKEGNFQVDDGDICINNNQPKSSLLQVLFEPKSKLSDSVTYDITAWSVPFAFSVQTYALKNRILSGNSFSNHVTDSFSVKFDSTINAYIFPPQGIGSSKILSYLLQNGVRVSVLEKDIKYAGRQYSKGSLVITKTSNSSLHNDLNSIIQKACNENDIWPSTIHTGFDENGIDLGSNIIHPIKPENIVLVTGNGVTPEAAGEIWYLFDHDLEYPVTLVNAENVKSIIWKNMDVLILPDGNYNFLNDTGLKEWVQQGGKIIALEKATLQMAKTNWGIKLKTLDSNAMNNKENIRRYENKSRDELVNSVLGAIYKVDLDNSHPLAFGYPAYYFSLKRNDNVYELSNDIWNVGTLGDQNYVTGFVGNAAKNKIKNGSVIMVQAFGKGSVIYFADDPIFRGFWENGKLLIANAVFLVGQ